MERELCQALLHDADETVRLEAAGAFETRPTTPQAVEALSEALGRDRSTSVRLAVLARLAGLVEKDPRAAAAVRRAAASDPAAEVREAAAAAVGKK